MLRVRTCRLVDSGHWTVTVSGCHPEPQAFSLITLGMYLTSEEALKKKTALPNHHLQIAISFLRSTLCPWPPTRARSHNMPSLLENAESTNGIVHEVDDQPRPETPVGRMALTDYSINPSPPSENSRSKVRDAIPEDLLLPDGYPDVCATLVGFVCRPSSSRAAVA